MGYFSENYAHGAKFKANGIGLPFAGLKDVVTENGLKWRRKACEDFKRVFDWEVSVELGDLYKMENEVIENIAEATANNDPAETDPAETDPTPDDSGEGGGDE